MCEPIKQDIYSETRVDDPGFVDEHYLIRYLTTPVQIVKNQDGSGRVSDQAFKPQKSHAGTSVDILCLLQNIDINPLSKRDIFPNLHAIAQITVGIARAHSGGVAWTPKPEEPLLTGFAREPNEQHGEIIKPISPADARRMVANARLIWIAEGIDTGPAGSNL